MMKTGNINFRCHQRDQKSKSDQEKTAFPHQNNQKPKTNDYEDQVKGKHNKKDRSHVAPQNNYKRATGYQETVRSDKPTVSILGDSMI